MTTKFVGIVAGIEIGVYSIGIVIFKNVNKLSPAGNDNKSANNDESVNDDKNVCAICKKSTKDTVIFRPSSCEHSFHFDCLKDIQTEDKKRCTECKKD